jgi:hypothetical protein
MICGTTSLACGASFMGVLKQAGDIGGETASTDRIRVKGAE